MKRIPFHTAALFLVVGSLALWNAGCNKSSDNPVTPAGPTLHAPTNLQAYSASQTAVGLQWTLSTSESDASFMNYSVKTVDSLGAFVSSQTVSKGNPTTVVSGLVEGKVYTFIIHSEGTGSTQSSDSATVSWSPARRLTTDAPNTVPIQVYEFASASGASGLQFYSSTSGGAMTQSLVASNPDRALADVYVKTETNGSLSLVSMLSSGVAGGRATVFSTVARDAADLDDPQATPPSATSYTLLTVAIPSTSSTLSKIFYARTVENRYIRILLMRNPATGSVIYSSSPDRYIKVQLSYQNQPGVIYVKAGG